MNKSFVINNDISCTSFTNTQNIADVQEFRINNPNVDVQADKNLVWNSVSKMVSINDGNEISQLNSSVIVTDTGANNGLINFTTDGVLEASINGTNGLNLVRSKLTVAGDDGNAGDVLTSDGVNVSWVAPTTTTNEISQLNSSVIVTDTGANGLINFTTDGVLEASINGTNGLNLVTSKLTVDGVAGAAGDVLTSNGVSVSWVAPTADITDTNTDATYYPIFTDGAGTSKTLNVDTVTPISVNPNTGDFTVVDTLKIDQTKVAVGKSAGLTTQGTASVAIGFQAGNSVQGADSVAVGVNAGNDGQLANAVAVGLGAGQTSQGTASVAIGTTAGQTSQGPTSVAIGQNAGNDTQGVAAIALGQNAGNANQGINGVAIGLQAGQTSQSTNSVAIGTAAGNTSQGQISVAIGFNAGQTSQGETSVAIGFNAGQTTQSTNSVAIGTTAGKTSQGTASVAIGQNAGNDGQLANAVAIGTTAGQTSQGTASVAIGQNAGNSNQGDNAIAIGFNSAPTSQPDNSIVINATGAVVNGVADGSVLTPLNVLSAVGGLYPMYWNSTTGEINPSPSSVNIYTDDGNIAAGRVATIIDDLTWTGGSITRTTNSVNVVEVVQESNFGVVGGGVIILTTNTVYVIKGLVNCTNRILINTEGIVIKGNDRGKDTLKYIGIVGAGDFITITDVNCEISNIKLSSSNTTGGDVILNASNFSLGAYNDGRLKVLTILNCQFRDCYDVLKIEGFDLVDFQQTLFWYVKATSIGCQFKNVSKLQISSCEYIRWFDETTIPTPGPGDYATASMIEVLADGAGNGNGATNISGCIFHPQKTQNGIDINTGSTTGFGTISGNTFIIIGLTTGETFLADSLTPALGAYSEIECLKFDILANNGILNSTAGVVMTMEGNTEDTEFLASNTPTQINTGGLALAQAFVRFSVTTAGRLTYFGTKQINASIHASISYSKQGGGGNDYTFTLRKNGVDLPGAALLIRAGGSEDSITMVYGTLFVVNDYIEIWIENTSDEDAMLITDWQVLIRE